MRACRRTGWTVLLPILLAGAIATRAADDRSYAAWSQYLGGSDSGQYSSLKQITKVNVKLLKLAWSYPAGPDTFVFDPIVVDGVMYVLKAGNRPAPPLRSGAPAVRDAGSSTPPPGFPGSASLPPAQGVGHEGGAGTAIAALDATTGKERWVHLNMGDLGTRGMNYWESKDRSDRRLLVVNAGFLAAIDARTGQTIKSFGTNGRADLSSGSNQNSPRPLLADNPGRIFENLLLVSLSEGGAHRDFKPADIHAYDVRTGKLQWVFHVIPRPGEFGFETWPPEAWKTAGGVHDWNEMTLDEKRGIAYIPLGTARYDFTGEYPAGDNLFANSLLALDARTGKRLWHFQMVHHDLWGYNLPTAPKLLTVMHDGRNVDAVAQPAESGFLYVFDRVTGEPLWPIEERPVPQTDLPGEWTSPTQPFPTKPPPFARHEGLFAPPRVRGSVSVPSHDGGSNWGAAAVDPARGLLYILSGGLQAFLTAYDLNTGAILWQVPADGLLQPEPRGSDTSALNPRGGPVVTAAGLIFLSTPSDHKARAFDQDTGMMLWERDLPTGSEGIPAVYEAGEREFVAFSVAPAPGAYMVFALPKR